MGRLLSGILCISLVCGLGFAGENYKLGAFLQLTGGNSAYGVEARNAVQLALDEINAQGGFNGQQVELIVYDTQGSAEEAVKIANRLIDVDQVSACIGSVLSNEVLAAAPYLNDAKITVVGLGLSPNWMVEDWPFVFRACMNNALSVPMAVDMAKKLGMSRMGIFKGQDDASLSTADTFAKVAKERGMEVVVDESYDLGDTDFSAQVANLIDAEPHAIYLSVLGETGPVIVKQLRQGGYSGIIIFKESFMVAQVEIAGRQAATNIIFANPYVTYASLDECDILIVHDFLSKYQAKYGDICKTDSAYRGWDSVMCLWEASKIAGTNDKEQLNAAMNKVVIDGLGGTLDFTDGTREGYGSNFNTFAFIDQKNILFDKWIADGGYDAYKEKTGNEF